MILFVGLESNQIRNGYQGTIGYISKNVSSPKIEWRHVSSDNLGRINIVYIPLQVPTQWILWPKTNEQVPFERTICSPTDSGRLILQNTKWNPIQSRNEFLTNQLIFLSVKEKKLKKRSAWQLLPSWEIQLFSQTLSRTLHIVRVILGLTKTLDRQVLTNVKSLIWMAFYYW